MTPDDLVDNYMSLFAGRTDAYGGWDGFAVKGECSRRLFVKHLTQGPYIGQFPLFANRARWGCIDIDGKDFPVNACVYDSDGWNAAKPTQRHDWPRMWVLARNLRAILGAGSVSAHIERTRNGFHVWVFPEEEWVSAAVMRRALMTACVALSYDPNEVNPKQEEVGGNTGLQYGNYVRLPYYGYLVEMPKDRFIVDPSEAAGDVRIDLEDWLPTALAERATTVHLEGLAALWVPPPRPILDVYETDLDLEYILPVLNGLAKTIWRDGPTAGSDRSTTLARLAHKAAETLIPEACFQVLKSADVRWGGKFAARADGDEQLAKMVASAYAGGNK